MSTLLFGTSIAALEKCFVFAVSSSGVILFTTAFKDPALCLFLMWPLVSWVTQSVSAPVSVPTSTPWLTTS